jgi:hypothetical protein
MSDAEDSRIYIAEFIDGPLEGRSERRVLVDGRHEQRLPMIVAVEGLESTLWYEAVEPRDVNGELQVSYRFDAPDSDPIEPDTEPGQR